MVRDQVSDDSLAASQGVAVALGCIEVSSFEGSAVGRVAQIFVRAPFGDT